jgi:hypothetical protein
MSEPQDPEAQPNYGDCMRCNTPLQAVGLEQFRVGGTSGGWHLLLGSWADLDEGMLSMEVFACPQCRKVELRVPVS